MYTKSEKLYFACNHGKLIKIFKNFPKLFVVQCFCVHVKSQFNKMWPNQSGLDLFFCSFIQHTVKHWKNSKHYFQDELQLLISSQRDKKSCWINTIVQHDICTNAKEMSTRFSKLNPNSTVGIRCSLQIRWSHLELQNHYSLRRKEHEWIQMLKGENEKDEHLTFENALHWKKWLPIMLDVLWPNWTNSNSNLSTYSSTNLSLFCQEYTNTATINWY